MNAACIPTDLAVKHTGMKAATLRQWAKRGKVIRCPGGYDAESLLAYLDSQPKRGRPKAA